MCIRDSHYAHCGEYRAILEHFHFSPETLRCETDLARLPALPTAFFKGREIYSMPRGRQLVRATSSGTKGQMSRIGFDAVSYTHLDVYKRQGEEEPITLQFTPLTSSQVRSSPALTLAASACPFSDGPAIIRAR